MGYDFGKLKFKINKIPKDQDIIDQFPQLALHPEFNSFSHKDRNKIVRYVILAYDPGSPFVEEYAANLTGRKAAAADEAGFERNKTTGLFGDDVVKIMNLEDEKVNEMIFCYFLKIINNQTWTLIITHEQVFSEYTRLLMEPVNYSSYTKNSDEAGEPAGEKVMKDDKKLLEAANMKSKLREECKSIATDLKGFYKELFGENEDLKEKVIAKPVRPETMIL
jgi:hypothetical protein